jgi:hypothetical protein
MDQMPSDHLSVSVKSGKNIDILKYRIEDLMLSLREKLLERESNALASLVRTGENAIDHAMQLDVLKSLDDIIKEV